MSKPNLHFFLEFSTFQTVLRENSGIVPETLVKIEIKGFCPKAPDWSEKHNAMTMQNDAIFLPSYWLRKL